MQASTQEEDLDRETEKLLGSARLAYFTPVREYPPLGDKKASTLLSVNAVMITVMTVFAPRWEQLVSGTDAVAWITGTVLVAWFFCMLLCAWKAFAALTYPIPLPEPDGEDHPSLAFFKIIAPLTPEKYEQLLRGMSHRRALRDILLYNYSLATLSIRKFKAIQQSVKFLCLAFLFWIMLMVLVAAGGKKESSSPAKPEPAPKASTPHPAPR